MNRDATTLVTAMAIVATPATVQSQASNGSMSTGLNGRCNSPIMITQPSSSHGRTRRPRAIFGEIDNCHGNRRRTNCCTAP